ncbi:interleukin-1 beta [Melanotaenia boesemani]|uniref:interleukin-1 beta n=1 Tax=Melanotaenia boesemani TaxID=1250792 RepID=UPI001C051A5C|nr:interleukin-1 beta [Melanotaenia boesemani]
MCDFELADALACSPEKACHCSDMMEEDREKFSGELDLTVSCHRTMKGVVTLVLVVNKINKLLSKCGRELSDDELYSFIMDQVVEETIVERHWNASMEQRKVIFERANSLRECMLTDMSQKNLILDSNCDEKHYKLQAITLKAGYDHLKVNFNMSRYISKPGATAVDSSCVLLSVKGKSIHLSCSWEDEKAVLNLEECHEEDLKKIYQDTDADRFLFIKKTTGFSLTTFESVKYPGWFITTSSDDRNHSVEMCEVESPRNRTFKVYTN